jgi:hypothetical protein
MGSNDTATATTGGPRVIGVFDGNGAPSGPNYLIFSGVDRLAGALRDSSKIGWSPTPHAPVLGAPQRALDRNLGGIMVHVQTLLGTCTDMYPPWKRPRMRRRQLHVYSTDPKRPQGDLRTTNRQDSTDAAVMAGPSISRIKKNTFFGPQ